MGKRLLTALLWPALACAGDPALRRQVADLSAEVERVHAREAARDGRIEHLENELALMAARRAQGKSPATDDPRAKLRTEKLVPRANPVLAAPPLPTDVPLQEPDDASMTSIESDGEGVLVRSGTGRAPAGVAAPPPAAEASKGPDPDQVFAAAVQRFNDGDRAGAASDFEAFARNYPSHAAADNALYLCGLSRALAGDCKAALLWFDRVDREYPAGDAVPPSLLEAARCEQRLKNQEGAKSRFARLVSTYPDTPEGAQARLALLAL